MYSHSFWYLLSKHRSVLFLYKDKLINSEERIYPSIPWQRYYHWVVPVFWCCHFRFFRWLYSAWSASDFTHFLGCFVHRVHPYCLNGDSFDSWIFLIFWMIFSFQNWFSIIGYNLAIPVQSEPFWTRISGSVPPDVKYLVFCPLCFKQLAQISFCILRNPDLQSVLSSYFYAIFHIF